MFGYVRIFKPELKFCEYDHYKAVYCTLCKRLGKLYGPTAKMLLNYDFTFVAMLDLALRKSEPCLVKKSCAANPLKSCYYCSNEEDKAFDFTCALTVMLFYHKLADNIQDSGFFGKIFYSMPMPYAKAKLKKAEKRYPEAAKIVADCMELQRQAEASPERNIDSVAEPSAKMISALAQMLSDDPEQKTLLKHFGFYLGRWIYLIDAFDDIEKDINSGSFNPFVEKCGLTKEDAEQNGEKLLDARLYANECLNMTVGRAVQIFELFELGKYKSIFDNIIYKGLGDAQRRALYPQKKKGEKNK